MHEWSDEMLWIVSDLIGGEKLLERPERRGTEWESIRVSLLNSLQRSPVRSFFRVFDETNFRISDIEGKTHVFYALNFTGVSYEH